MISKQDGKLGENNIAKRKQNKLRTSQEQEERVDEEMQRQSQEESLDLPDFLKIIAALNFWEEEKRGAPGR